MTRLPNTTDTLAWTRLRIVKRIRSVESPFAEYPRHGAVVPAFAHGPEQERAYGHDLAPICSPCSCLGTSWTSAK
jgi:hypothetical protein